MSAGTFYGLLTLLLMLVFAGIWIWAWSSRRRKSFEHAARLPLEDDYTQQPAAQRPEGPQGPS